MKKEKPEITDQTVITKVEKMPEEGEKRAYILFLSGPLVGKIQQLKEGETRLGRAPDVDISINDNRISRHHLSIAVGPGKTVLKDQGSTNGTYVNGKRTQTHVLQDGDKVQLSSATIFKFAYQDNIENVFHKELYKMAVLDAVTGIFNKRYFLDRFKEEFSHAKRTKTPLSLIMLDIDHFKKVNDTHGHLAGDIVLGHLAQMLRRIVRTEDIAARYGGEEFAVILRGSDEKGSYLLAERIRKTIAASPAHAENSDIPLTVSLGVATLQTGNDFKTPEELIAAADQSLYLSKKQGRNKTTAKKTSNLF